jgi:hypothetical protein
MAAMATVITVLLATRLILKSNTMAVRSVKKGVNYVRGTLFYLVNLVQLGR